MRISPVFLSVALLAAGLAAPAGAAEPLTPVQKQTVDQMIHDYLLSHPDVIIEAVRKAEAELKEQKAADSRQAIKDRRDALLHDGLAIVDRPLIDYRQHGENEVGMAELSFAGKLGRMLEPGGERNARLHERARSLAARTASGDHPLTAERVRAVHAKLVHEDVRSTLSRHRIARIGPVLREARTGRYGEFGRGAADALRDLLQPL